jgi:hypothetical protein
MGRGNAPQGLIVAPIGRALTPRIRRWGFFLLAASPFSHTNVTEVAAIIVSWSLQCWNWCDETATKTFTTWPFWRGLIAKAGAPALTLLWSPSSNNCVRYCEACSPEDGASRAESNSPPSSNRRMTVLPDCCKSIYVTWDSPVGRSPHHAAQDIRSVWFLLSQSAKNLIVFFPELIECD